MDVMNDVHLSSVDLNLLKVFDAVAEQGSTTRAAERLGLTQSAVSHALSRLRQMLQHELFVRERGGLTATPLAREIAPRVRELLIQATQIVQTASEFDPATSQRTFTVAMPDYATVAVLPALKSALAQESPRTNLTIVQEDSLTILDRLERGSVSLAVGNIPTSTPDIEVEPLFEDALVCAAREDHDIWKAELTIDRYLRYEHLDVVRNPNQPGLTERVLARSGHRRNVTLRIGTFLAVPQLVSSLGLVASEPARILTPLSESLGYRTAVLPYPSPAFTVSVAKHRRIDSDPGYRWLWGQIAALFRNPVPTRS